ncbi:serine palmitoyltransferase 1-like [Ornithodoros turicata]
MVVNATWELYEMFQAFLKAPVYHLTLEALLFMWVLWLMLRKSSPVEGANGKLTEKEKDDLIEEWTPDPLVPDTPPDHYAVKPRIVSGKVGTHVIVDGKECINLATHNYLALVEADIAEEAALRGLRKYGVGSCGPRGFFGTVDIHLELESRIAEFMGVEEACLYSFGFSSISSAIPAYAKQGDVIFADEEVNFAIQKGLVASRSLVRYFKHNDMEDLERQLEEEHEKDIKDPSKASVTRRFLVVEGIYANTGDLCPLPKICELRARYKVRLLMDESCSFGVLGKTGRGVREHFNVPNKEIDLMSASLENAVGSYGGFCCGTSYVVDHQRLSGLGYCFSASLPPLQAAVSLAAIDYLSAHLDTIEQLHNNCRSIHEKLKSIPQFVLGGDVISPVKHLYVAAHHPHEMATGLLDSVVQRAWEEGIALTQARYLGEEHLKRAPSIRITVSSALTAEEINKVYDVLCKAAETYL